MIKKEQIQALLQQALSAVQADGQLLTDEPIKVQVERAKDPTHGDYASNLALILAKKVNKNSREVAQSLIDVLPTHPDIEQVSLAGPGFINFKLNAKAHYQIIAEILAKKDQFGLSTHGHGQRVHLEFVSANPTGPLHVGHGRSAAFGSCVANLLNAVGYEVHSEYYVNDAGRQMRILALSTWLRYLALQGEAIEFPPGAYQGDYIIEIATELQVQFETEFLKPYADFVAFIDKTVDLDNKDAQIDAMVNAMIAVIGDAAFNQIRVFTLQGILADIQDDLTEFKVIFNQWFKESGLFEQGLFEQGIDLLKDQGYTYEKDGAVWFKATEFGDEKDRVLVRENGLPTYFASDVAYHLYKYNQGFDHIFDVFGADHHGYIARIRAFLKGLGKDPAKLKILLVQFAILYRGKDKVSMSTRGGDFVTLRELRAEVGNDAARFFYIMRKPEQHLDFDLELAKSRSSDNPVYYIQYANARIHSVFSQLNSNNQDVDWENGLAHLDLLQAEHEQVLVRNLNKYCEMVALAATQQEPHRLAHYLQELANSFHTYYNASKFLVEDNTLRDVRLCLIKACSCVITNGLCLLGVSAPTHM